MVYDFVYMVETYVRINKFDREEQTYCRFLTELHAWSKSWCDVISIMKTYYYRRYPKSASHRNATHFSYFPWLLSKRKTNSSRRTSFYPISSSSKRQQPVLSNWNRATSLLSSTLSNYYWDTWGRRGSSRANGNSRKLSSVKIRNSPKALTSAPISPPRSYYFPSNTCTHKIRVSFSAPASNEASYVM